MTRPPLVAGGLAMVEDYLKSMLEGRPRSGDATFRSFLCDYQWACLLKGKQRATAGLNAPQASLWNPARP
jgi:poly-beta-1,6-N-acetyl-D-glucosamine synthase